MKLFSPYKLGKIELKNRIVMAPMTRCRAINNIPNELMANYYRQRSGAGLIITEGVAPSPNGLGYARMPGIFSEEQCEGWRLITDAVHGQGGRIFVQLMHTGRMSHPANMPGGSVVLAPSAIAAPAKLYTDSGGLQEVPVPVAMTAEDILATKKEFMKAAINAITAGFDGVELHGANGYLLEQFISPVSNQRGDSYGGNPENRCRFVIEIAAAVGQAIGMDKTAIRLSPYGVNGGMKYYDEVDDTYRYLATELDKLGILYVHIVDHSASGAPVVPRSVKEEIRSRLSGATILAGGYSRDRAEKELQLGYADLIAFGKPFISNPDLVDRMILNQPWNVNWDPDTFYSPGPEGYTDYPVFQA